MTAAREEYRFEDGPPHWAQRSFGRFCGRTFSLRRVALLVVATGWVPLVVLAGLQSLALGPQSLRSFALQIGLHSNYLVAAPLLVLSEAYCLPQLGATVTHFLRSGIVPEEDRGRLEDALARTCSLLQRPASDVAIVAIAYAAVALLALSQGYEGLPAWHRLPFRSEYSPAGWWNVLVSLPLLLVLIFRWMLRLALWARLLSFVSRLDLRLVASHPDRVCGLAFVGHSAMAFSPVALALTTIAAGRLAHVVLVAQDLPVRQLYFDAGLVGALLIFFTAPLFAFTPSILRTWRQGVLAYGALAGRVGSLMEQKWLGRHAKIDLSAFEAADFSATTDLNAIVSNVFAVRFVPLTLTNAAVLVIAMLLPFVPAVFLAVPAETLWSMAKNLLF